MSWFDRVFASRLGTPVGLRIPIGLHLSPLPQPPAPPSYPLFLLAHIATGHVCHVVRATLHLLRYCSKSTKTIKTSYPHVRRTIYSGHDRDRDGDYQIEFLFIFLLIFGRKEKTKKKKEKKSSDPTQCNFCMQHICMQMKSNGDDLVEGFQRAHTHDTTRYIKYKTAWISQTFILSLLSFGFALLWLFRNRFNGLGQVNDLPSSPSGAGSLITHRLTREHTRKFDWNRRSLEADETIRQTARGRLIPSSRDQRYSFHQYDDDDVKRCAYYDFHMEYLFASDHRWAIKCMYSPVK